MYRLGVEDNGCHSLLNYKQIAESARVVECIARSLNAVVVERKMIQNEVYFDELTGEPTLCDKSKGGPIYVGEAPILGDASGNKVVEERKHGLTLRKEDGVYTRAELTIQRIETHLLDPSPATTDPQSDTGTEKTSTDFDDKKLSVGETLSSRNLRIAVVGNVDAGMCKFQSAVLSFRQCMLANLFYLD